MQKQEPPKNVLKRDRSPIAIRQSRKEVVKNKSFMQGRSPNRKEEDVVVKMPPRPEKRKTALKEKNNIEMSEN
jgi:hypothetical protein